MIDLYLLSVLIFFSILAVLIYRDRKNIDIKYILFMRRTKKFRNILDRIARKSILFWKIIGTIAFIVCLYYMIIGTYSMIRVAQLIYAGVIAQPALSIALPVPTEEVVIAPGFIGIPFWFWIIVVAVLLIPHEAFHGIIARAEKIKLKDVGLLLLAIFPGAFVEPNEKQLKKSRLMTKLRIFSAGSFINIVIGLSIIFLVQNLIWAPNVNGILITNVNETTPAGYAGLKEGTFLESINGKELSMSFNDYSFSVLTIPGVTTKNATRVLSSFILFIELSWYKPGDNITLRANGVVYEIELAEHPEIENFPYIGIGSVIDTKDVNLFLVLFPLLALIASLSILIGIFNILPIYPLDGGLIVKAFADKYIKKRSNQITIGITLIMLFIIIYSFVGGFF